MFGRVEIICSLVFLYAVVVLVHSEESSSGDRFLSSLVSRVREPQEVREFRTSCVKEPGCSWKCPQNGQCHCACGNRTGDSGEKQKQERRNKA